MTHLGAIIFINYLNLYGLTWDSQFINGKFNDNVGPEYFDTPNKDFYDLALGLLYNKKLSKWKPEFTKIKLNIKTLPSKS